MFNVCRNRKRAPYLAKESSSIGSFRTLLMKNDRRPLKGKVAVVAGAARGAGRGIARMLGEAGATVYCTGRSSRTQPNTSSHHYAGRPETIEETAEMVDAAGGAGVPARVDHTVESEVTEFFKRVKRER